MKAWVLSGYQRLERLAVPAFAAGRKEFRRQLTDIERVDVRRLPAVGLPRELCDLDAWLSGGGEGLPDLDAGTRLSLFFRYLAGPLRYEPHSESAIHKAVPSSRGRYPLKYFLLQSIAGRLRVHAYVPEFHGLQTLPDAAVSGLAEGETALVCVGRAWRYAEEYGEFAHVPCVLEAGHAYAQAHHLAQLLDIGGSADPDRGLGRGLCGLPFEIPLFCVALRMTLDVERLAADTVKLAAPRPYPEMASAFPEMHLFQRCFDGGNSPGRRPPSVAASTIAVARRDDIGGRGVLDLMRRRSSGNDRGLVSSVLSEVSAGTFASLVATWRAIHDRRAGNAAEQGLALSLVWLAQEPGRDAGIYDIDGASTTLRPWRGDLRDAITKMLPYANTRYNFSALTAILIVQADMRGAIERLGGAALREIHIAAGAAAQDFSIAATAHDMFARPVKMMREARLESEIALRGQAVYLVISGFSRSANPTLELY